MILRNAYPVTERSRSHVILEPSVESVKISK